MVRMDNSKERQIALQEKLIAMGCKVDEKKRGWTKAGDFSG